MVHCAPRSSSLNPINIYVADMRKALHYAHDCTSGPAEEEEECLFPLLTLERKVHEKLADFLCVVLCLSFSSLSLPLDGQLEV